MIINEATSSGLAKTLIKRLDEGKTEKEIINFILSVDPKIYCDKKLGEWDKELPSLANFKKNVAEEFGKLNKKNKNIKTKEFVERVVTALTDSKNCTINDMSYGALLHCQMNGIKYDDWMSGSASVVSEETKVNYFDY